MAEKSINLTVRPGRTVLVGEAQTGADGKPAAPKQKTYGPGTTLTLPQDEAERLIREGSVLRSDAPEAREVKRVLDIIPANFPHADVLAKNGIETFAALDSVEDLEELDGIGPTKAEDIRAALDARG